MSITDNHQKILQACKDYIISSSQDFIEIKKKELKNILSALIHKEDGEQYVQAYNKETHQQMTLPKKETMLLNMIESGIPKKADLHFLPTYDDDGISFKFFTPQQTYYVHTQKVPFKQEVQDIIKEVIMPDIDKEFEKSEDHFLIKYIQIGKRLQRAIITAINSFIRYIENEKRNEPIQELGKEVRINSRYTDRLEKTILEKPASNQKQSEKTQAENAIISALVQEIAESKNEDIKGMVSKITTNDNEDIKALMATITTENKRIRELLQTLTKNNDEAIKTLARDIKKNNAVIKELLKRIREEDNDHSKELYRELQSDATKHIQGLLKEMKEMKGVK
jgi:hypothetical protein